MVYSAENGPVGPPLLGVSCSDALAADAPVRGTASMHTASASTARISRRMFIAVPSSTAGAPARAR
jgi:hypothetical protein